MDKNETLKLSVLDVEERYKYEYSEPVYSADQIVSYGSDNLAPILFNNCYKNSATLKSIIDGSVNYVVGDGVEVNDCLATLREQVNRNGLTMREFVAKLAMSYFKFGGYAFQVIYSKIGVPVELYPLDFGRCRINEDGTKIFYSKKQWGRYTSKADSYDRFNKKNFDPKKPTQIFYFKGDFTENVYPLPPYYAAIKDILTEIECSKYSLNSVSKGFSARYIFNFPGVDNVTDDQKRDIEKSIKSKFCGSDTDVNFMLYWSDGEDKLEIQKLETDDAPEKFIAIKDNARENIYTSMRCTPNLFGLVSKNTGFNSQEYSSAFKLYQKTVIQAVQDGIKANIDKVFGVKDGISIIPFFIDFSDEK